VIQEAMTFFLARLIGLAFKLVYLLILARVIVSWLPINRWHPVVIWIYRVTEPMLKPFRNIVSPARTGGLDLSPIFLLLVLWIVESIIHVILR